MIGWRSSKNQEHERITFVRAYQRGQMVHDDRGRAGVVAIYRVWRRASPRPQRPSEHIISLKSLI
jgi:hypothetical protein